MQPRLLLRRVGARSAGFEGGGGWGRGGCVCDTSLAWATHTISLIIVNQHVTTHWADNYVQHTRIRSCSFSWSNKPMRVDVQQSIVDENKCFF